MADVEKGRPKAYAEVAKTKEQLAESRWHLLLAKLVYFFVFAADASWEPFAAYFLSTRNIGTGTIGLLIPTRAATDIHLVATLVGVSRVQSVQSEVFSIADVGVPQQLQFATPECTRSDSHTPVRE